MKICVGLLLWLLGRSGVDMMEIPRGLSIGASTSAYQVEGGWNASDKGVSVWDAFTHEESSLIKDRENGDIACDSYHKYQEDVALAKNMGLQHYRFSVSWTRILPNGSPENVSRVGIRYYKNLIDELHTYGIEPVVTLYHWDHPQSFEEVGGWANDNMIDYFVEYARVVFRELGSRVKIWSTVNEPIIYCQFFDFGMNDDTRKYRCAHNLLKAHAKVYHMYQREFKDRQHGQVGIVLLCHNYYSMNGIDAEAEDIAFEFGCGWLANPIFSKDGDYPAVMKQKVAEESKYQGFTKSKLPKLSSSWIEYIKGSSDYFGLNHYTSFMVEQHPHLNDSGILKSDNPIWKKGVSDWLNIIPEGFGEVLRIIKEKYNNPPVYVLENGLSTTAGIEDLDRIKFLHDYMKQMIMAITHDGCNVQKYTVWSLLDTFEWKEAYRNRFGLVHVDFTNNRRMRTPKLSSKWLHEVITQRQLIKPDEFMKQFRAASYV